MLGFEELGPLGYIPLLVILVYSFVSSFLVNDWLKVYLLGRFYKSLTVTSFSWTLFSPIFAYFLSTF